MLTKFETKSAKIKAVAFHPKRPWVLSALYTGSIQLWDYKLGTLIETFDEHQGPVRGLAFHPTQPMFVSAGDDYKIKVWNLKTNSTATLLGHIDFVRCVSFHHDLPWVISCGDDQTIRIWNWQSRTCLSVLTGHSHYVMSAFFHPKEDLIVSSSLDQTIRVWDIQGLRKKHSAGRKPSEDRFTTAPGVQQDVFGNMDCVVKYVLEGHSRGVNWAEFHPTLPLIISCADDRLVKLWRMNDSKAWEVDTCRGHYNNPSAVLFSAKQDVIISCAEDKTVRVWDMTKRTCLQTFRREHEKFWCLASHPEMNMFAAGHDGGLVVFKLERERPAYDIFQDTLFYIKDKTLRKFSFQTAQDVPAMNIKRGHIGTGTAPRTLSYNPAENSILLQSGTDEPVFDMYNIPRDPNAQSREPEPRRGQGNSAIYVARNRFATIEKGKLFIKDLQNQSIKELAPNSKSGKPLKLIDVFPAANRCVLLTTSTLVVLFDFENMETVAEISMNGVRYVAWNQDQTKITLISKHNIIIADKKLEQLCLVHETVKIKSGAWDASGVFVYSTLNHIKYCLSNGDSGVVRSIEQPIYIVRVRNNLIHVLTRQGKVEIITFDPTEYKFKLALVNRNYDEVFHLIQTSNLMGQAIIGYLQKKGYPEIALQFVKDPKTRFDLAIECGNIDAAFEMAKVIDKEQYWKKLGAESLRQGNQTVLEVVYQKTKNFDGLSFLYLTTGNRDKLKKMLKISEARKDPMSRYQNALFLGDVPDQIRNLIDAGQLSLAYLAAQTHGLYEEAEKILILSGLRDHPSILPSAQLAVGPVPISKQTGNWPLLTVTKNLFESKSFTETTNPPASAILRDADLNDVGDWGDEELDGIDEPPTNAVSPARNASLDVEDETDGWGAEDDLDIPEVSPVNQAAAAFVAPKHGLPLTEVWKQSPIAADHIAAGSFESAMDLLNHQIGAVNFTPLKPYFLAILQATRVFVEATPSCPPITSVIARSWDDSKTLPKGPFVLDSLIAQLQEAYPIMTAGKFSDAVVVFQKILHESIFVTIKSEQEESELSQLIGVCREYLLGLATETSRKEIATSDPKRGVELAAYFTHCQLQSAHLVFALRAAMIQAFKLRNFATAKSFASRLIELGPPAQFIDSAKKIIAHGERNGNNEVPLDYDPKNPFVLCAGTLTPIYQGTPSLTCLYCGSSYKLEMTGTTCTICQVTKIGATGTGLVRHL